MGGALFAQATRFCLNFADAGILVVSAAESISEIRIILQTLRHCVQLRAQFGTSDQVMCLLGITNFEERKSGDCKMKRFQVLGLVVVYCGLCMGCGDTGQMTTSQGNRSSGHEDDHDHEEGHDHPKTLEDGIKELVTLRDTVRDAFAKNDTETAHGPLHDVGHLLEDITGLIEKGGLSDEAVASAKQNIETLFNSFGAVDKTMHGQEGSTYSEVSAKIDAAIQALQTLTSADAAPAIDAATPTESKPDEAAKADGAATTDGAAKPDGAE